MTQMVLAIPINDMVSSAASASVSNQQQLQQQLLYHSSNSTRQKNINRQQLNQTCPLPLSLPLNRYFQQQHQTAADDAVANIAGASDNVASDNSECQYYLTVLRRVPALNCRDLLGFLNFLVNAGMINSNATAPDLYNSIQRRKWQSSDVFSKKHNFLSVRIYLRRTRLFGLQKIKIADKDVFRFGGGGVFVAGNKFLKTTYGMVNNLCIERCRLSFTYFLKSFIISVIF